MIEQRSRDTRFAAGLRRPGSRRPARLTPQRYERSRSSLAGVRVLVVEDDAASAKLVSVVLQGEGCAVRVASTAEEAERALADFAPQVIVLDFVLPTMSGLLFAQRLAAREGERPAVVATSVMSGPEVARLALDAGCAVYLPKPIDPLALPAVVASCLGGQP